ncbi:MAG: hypothetical protein ACLP0J_08195 [Solirubrobacteraceae bacterium]
MIRTDDPDAMREAAGWALRAERRLHPGGRPRFDAIAPARPVVRP